MEPLEQAFNNLPTLQQRLSFIERLIDENPDDITAWLYLADYYLHRDLEKTVYAWEQIARLRPNDAIVALALQSIREVNSAL